MIQTHQRRNTHERHSRRHHFYNNLGDCLRFWVGSSVDLTHKTGDSKMTVANKDGWIRNRGKCPVKPGTLVDVKYRDGSISENVPALLEAGIGWDARDIFWKIDGQSGDIMQWRLSKPKPEQQEPQPMTAEQIRAQYMENLSSIAMLHTKNAALVDDLRKMGFDFYDALTEPQEDMTDPKNWRVGDELQVISEVLPTILPHGSIQRITAIKGDIIRFTDTCGGCVESIEHITELFKFHSRPTK